MTAQQPSFVLSGPSGTLVGEGIRASYDDIDAAAEALRDGTAEVVVGALPFDLRRPAALLKPVSVSRALPLWPTTTLPPVWIAETLPDPDVHRARVEAALRRLRHRESRLEKVVLARALRLVADRRLDPLTILHRLLATDREATAYLADLSPAGPRLRGQILVGASPELLVARSGDQVSCQPFAGSAPRSTDPDVDAANRAALAASGKDRREHQLVVDAMRAALEPLCTDLEVAAEPHLSSTAALWHLSTPIRGTLRETSITALDLAIALHPTPAVAGVPTAEAMELIDEVEGDRGFYAGAVGWCDGDGDGRWVVAIRGAQLSADGREALAHAGGGIVAESDADAEVSETTTKFRTILTALGVS